MDSVCECVIEVSEAALLMVIEEYEEADEERLGEQVRPSNTPGELHGQAWLLKKIKGCF